MLSRRVLELRRVGSDRFGDTTGGCEGVEAVLVLGDDLGALFKGFLELDLAAAGGALIEDGRGVDTAFCVLVVVLVRLFCWLGELCAAFEVPLVVRFALRGCSSGGSMLVRPDLRFPSSMNVVGPSASTFFQGGDSTLVRRIGL